MISSERQQRIMDMLSESRHASAAELQKALNISESTLRRDLVHLEKMGRLQRVHGGASIIERTVSKDRNLSLKRQENLAQKTEIGKTAVSLIEPGDFIYMDAGTTTETMIDLIDQPDIRVVTNSINHAQALADKGIEVSLVGGQFKSLTNAIVGEEALSFLEKYHFDKGFFGTNAISDDGSLLTPDVREAAVKSRAMKQCQSAYVLADASKFSKNSSIKFGTLNRSVLISDRPSNREGILELNVNRKESK